MLILLRIFVFALIMHPPIALLHRNDNSADMDTTQEFISSHSNLKRLAEIEETIYNTAKQNFQDVSEGVSKSNHISSRYLEDYESSTGKVVGNSDEKATEIASHPLLSFRMMFRFSQDLPKFELQDIPNVLFELSENGMIFPDDSDFTETMSGIVRIVHIYDLDVEEFAAGTIQGHVTGQALTARHCFALGSHAFENLRYFAQAVEWLELGKALLQMGQDSTIDEETLTKKMLKAVSVHDKEMESIPDYADIFFLRKIVRKKGDRYIFDGFVRRMKQRTNHYRLWKGRRQLNYNEINFWGLCSGNNLQTDDEKSNLFCWYESKSNLAWTIGPLKMELLSNDPFIVQIYDVLSNSDMEQIIVETEPELMKSKVFNMSAPQRRSISRQRTSMNTWLREDRVPELYNRISRRVELITGLHVVPNMSSEILQIATYSFGGHYSVHLDAMRDPQETWFKLKGDRIATFMIYLSDVKAGGFTAFVNAGTAARPIKGSAVFWYNMKQNGEVDERTHHGACPVILGGNKWVANKWIRANDQFLARKCSVDSEL